MPEDTAIPNGEEIRRRLKDLIMKERKGLQKMFGDTEAELDEGLTAPIKRGEEMARKLVNKMGCNRMIAKELTVLTLYDVAILIDDSDSMIHEEGGSRKKTLIQFIDHITEIYSIANESGILALTFTNHRGGKRNWTGRSQEYLDHHNYGGMARIGTELKRRILDKFVIGNSTQRKPLLVLIVTAGVIAGERKGHLKNAIRDCLNEREGAGKGFDAVAFQFSLIGRDPGAISLLKDLDQDPDLGDFIDMFPIEFDLSLDSDEGDKWWVLPKILLGAILPDWDQQDHYDYTAEENRLVEDVDQDDSGEDWDD